MNTGDKIYRYFRVWLILKANSVWKNSCWGELNTISAQHIFFLLSRTVFEIITQTRLFKSEAVTQ
jgi:hypothetical protein